MKDNMQRKTKRIKNKCAVRALTVDGNGNGLGQLEAIGTGESWNFIERIDLDEIGIAAGWGSLDDINVKVVCLSDNRTGECARVVLEGDIA